MYICIYVMHACVHVIYINDMNIMIMYDYEYEYDESYVSDTRAD